MAIIPEITCRRCGSKYSALRGSCPKCGAPKVTQSSRVPTATTSAPREGTDGGAAPSAMNLRWQVIFAAVLILAVILAVLVLVLTSKSGRSTGPSIGTATASSQGTAVYMSADLPTPSPSPAPTPVATPAPAIESMAISFLNNPVKSDLTLSNPGELEIDLDLNVYPPQDDPDVYWWSTNEKILTVDERGVVKVVGASPNYTTHATIVAECGGAQVYVTVYVPSFQSAYLTENLFDENTYASDNLEWDTIIYATPTPKAG